MSMVYIVVLTMFEEDVALGYTNVHGQYFDPSLATGAAGLATQSVSIHHPDENGHFPEEAYSHTGFFLAVPQHRRPRSSWPFQ